MTLLVSGVQRRACGIRRQPPSAPSNIGSNFFWAIRFRNPLGNEGKDGNSGREERGSSQREKSEPPGANSFDNTQNVIYWLGGVATASPERRHVRSVVIYSLVRGLLVAHVQPASRINTD